MSKRLQISSGFNQKSNTRSLRCVNSNKASCTPTTSKTQCCKRASERRWAKSYRSMHGQDRACQNVFFQDLSSLARTSRWMDSNSGSLAQRASDTTDWKVGLARSQRLHCLFTLHSLYHAQSETQARIAWKQCQSSRANTGAANFASSLGSQNSASICLPAEDGQATRGTTEFSSASSRRIVIFSWTANRRWFSAVMQMLLLPQRPPYCVSIRSTKSVTKSPTVIHCSKCSWYTRSMLAFPGSILHRKWNSRRAHSCWRGQVFKRKQISTDMGCVSTTFGDMSAWTPDSSLRWR